MADRNLTEAEQAYEEYESEVNQSRHDAVYNRVKFEGLQIDPDVDFYPEVADREAGDGNIVKWGFDLHPQVTFVAGGFLLVFLFAVVVFEEQLGPILTDGLGWINTTFGWFYILSANIIVGACAYFAFSRFGKIRLGGPAAKPEFTNVAWYAMLLSAGMGIGLMFWSVAEPIFHLTSPAPLFGIEGNTPEAGRLALATTYFHWGLHPWGIYALVSLALGFFAFNRGLPLTFRSVFYPLLGEKIYGTWGNVIDILTVLATLFGLASSLGFGVQQASAGLNFLFGWPNEPWFHVIMIAGITGLATMSVVAGLDGGVKRLSQLNMGLAGAFLIFLIIVGPTLFLLSVFGQSVGTYFAILPEISFWGEAFEGTGWQGSWTVFYWGWWISWSPFVGMFIARVSKGRTVRELILGVMVVPSLLSFFWMSMFGGTALYLQLNGIRDVATAVNNDVAVAMFDMFEALPFTTLTSIFAVILVISFFVTSSDSGSLVVDHLTSGGKLDSPKPQRVFWAVMEGAIAAVLLLGGGLSALQTAAVATGLPFAAVLLIMIWSMRTAFTAELDLLEGHYDAAQFRSRHVDLLDRLGQDGDSELAAANERGGS